MNIRSLADFLNRAVERGNGDIPVVLGTEGRALESAEIASAFMQSCCYLYPKEKPMKTFVVHGAYGLEAKSAAEARQIISARTGSHFLIDRVEEK